MFSINTMYHIDGFLYVEPSLHSWNKFQLIMVCNPFYMLLDLVCELLKIFSSVFIRDIGL